MTQRIRTTALVPLALRDRFGSGVLFSVVAAFFNSGSTFLVNIVLANLLGRETFGEIAIIQNTLLTLSTVASLATGMTATKYVAEFRSVDKAKTARVLGLCSVLSLTTGALSALALFFGAAPLADVVLKAPHLTVGVMLAAPVVFFNVHNFVQTGALAGLEHYTGIAKAGVIAGTAYCLLCVGGAYAWGREGALAGLAASAGVQWLLLGYFLRQERLRQGIGIEYRGWVEERTVLAGFAFPAALSGLSSMPALWLSNTFLVGQAGGYAQMALYAAATNLRVLVLIVPQLVNNVGMSLLNNLKGLGDTHRYRRVFWSNLGVVTGLAVLGVLGMVVFGSWVLAVFGRSFSEGYPVLVVLLISTLIEILMQAGYQIVQSSGRMWLSLLVIALPRDMLIIVLAYVLTPSYGAMGLALAYTIGWSLALLSTAIVAASISLRKQEHSVWFSAQPLVDR